MSVTTNKNFIFFFFLKESSFDTKLERDKGKTKVCYVITKTSTRSVVMLQCC
jgi:hypothetical protein